MDFIITQASIEDLSCLNRISVESKAHWGYPPEWMARWKEELTLQPEDFNEMHIFKLVIDGLIAGFCAIEERAAVYEIMHLWVKPAFIGQGLGKLLLEETIAAAVKKPKDIIVEADPNAEAFYARQGFVTFKKVESFPKGRYLPVMRRGSTFPEQQREEL